MNILNNKDYVVYSSTIIFDFIDIFYLFIDLIVDGLCTGEDDTAVIEIYTKQTDIFFKVYQCNWEIRCSNKAVEDHCKRIDTLTKRSVEEFAKY